MRNKVKIVYRVGKRVAKKAATGRLKYNGKGPLKASLYAGKYIYKYGPRAFVGKLKQELVRIDRRLGNNLYFPNGLVSGVDQMQIINWHKKHARPVTIVIPSYNDLEVLVPCLESIAATTNPKVVKVLVVDDYCIPEHSKKMKALENDQVKVVLRDKNGGFAKAVLTGLKAADKRHDIILLNSDTEAHAGWLEALQYGAYEFGVDTGIVGPKLLYPDGRIQSAGSYRNTEATEYFDHYYRFQDANYGPANVPQYCVGVTGACMYVKREFIKNVGLIDDKFSFAFEDADWCLRGWEAGYRSLYFPSAVLTHKEGTSRPKNKTISEKEQQSVDYFWKKWGDWFDKRNVRDARGRIKVIYVLQTLGRSGGIKMVFEHANRLPKDKFSVEIWGLNTHPPVWELEDWAKLRTFKNYDRMAAALENEEAIKVATWWETAFPVWLASVKKGIATYFVQEIETWFYPGDVVAQSAVVSCYRKEFKNFTTSQYNLQEIQEMGLKAATVPCGYDPEINKSLPEVQRKENTLVCNGRKFFQKNFDFTLKGWKAMGEKRPEFLLYGNEPELARLDKKITYVTSPSDEEVNKMFNQATVFVQTSLHEGFCLPLLEAMATGAPVVCTDAHGNRDFCFNEKNCLMVEHNDVEGLRAALERMFSDKALRDRLGAAGKSTAENYQWNKVIRKLEKFYEGIAP